MLTTVNGATLTVLIRGGIVHILNNDGTIDAIVSLADVMASNGVIHVIDQVLIPAANTISTTASVDSTSGEGGEGSTDAPPGSTTTRGSDDGPSASSSNKDGSSSTTIILIAVVAGVVIIAAVVAGAVYMKNSGGNNYEENRQQASFSNPLYDTVNSTYSATGGAAPTDEFQESSGYMDVGSNNSGYMDVAADSVDC